MNAFYIVSVTAIDITRLLKNTDYYIKYNNLVRKYYLRICFSFTLLIVFLYWMLIYNNYINISIKLYFIIIKYLIK